MCVITRVLQQLTVGGLCDSRPPSVHLLLDLHTIVASVLREHLTGTVDVLLTGDVIGC